MTTQRDQAAPPLRVDQVYVTTMPPSRPTKHRRIVALIGGHVIYSVGTDRNRSCKEETMRRWIRRRHAELKHAPTENIS